MIKKASAILLAFILLITNSLITAGAYEVEPYAVIDDAQIAGTGISQNISLNSSSVLNVPKIEINTEDGNGTKLQKTDGYVNAQISITDTDGTVLNKSVLLKVRGNSTALESIEKKSFNFKFDKKTEVLGMGAGKKWALLANCFDPTLLRNYLVFDFAQKLGLPYTSEQRYAELWLDGEYRGCYTVYEPVQEGKDRVDIDIESNSGKKDYLIEYEATRNEADVTYINVGGLRFAVSEPEEPDSEQLSYIKAVMTDIINTLKSGNEKEIRKKIDIDSFAKLYLLNEYAKTADFGYSSVFFFYKNGILYAGPPWDYDLALGNLNCDLNSSSAKAASVSDGIMQSEKNFYRWLCNKDWFNNEIKRLYYQNKPYIDNISANRGLLDKLRADHSEVFAHNFTKWNVGRWWLNYQKVPYKTYDENYSFLKKWCGERNKWLTDYFNITSNTVMIGDADSDREVTGIDATAIQREVLDIPLNFNVSVQAGDVDFSGHLEITDAAFIQRYVIGINTPYSIGSLSMYDEYELPIV